MTQIVHVIQRDKFTCGYIEFMQMTFSQYKHVFFTQKKDENLFDIPKYSNVYYISSYFHGFLKNKDLYKACNRSSKIIIPGLFDYSVIVFLFLHPRLLRKSYLHFWGADFYSLRKKEKNIIKKILRLFRIQCFRNCAGLVFLTDGEYDIFRGITGVSNNNFVAPMLGSPLNKIDYSKYKSVYNDNKLRIIVGNSATKTNHHEEVFKLLKPLLVGNFSIICPLSYGDENYGNYIEKLGYDLFGNDFIPLRTVIEKKEYIQLLANCDVGIFNNDRQQAMGNIYALLALGKTVYIRRNTTMWNKYINSGYIVKNIETINTEGISLITAEESLINQNPDKLIARKLKGIEQWHQVLEN